VRAAGAAGVLATTPSAGGCLISKLVEASSASLAVGLSRLRRMSSINSFVAARLDFLSIVALTCLAGRKY